MSPDRLSVRLIMTSPNLPSWKLKHIESKHLRMLGVLPPGHTAGTKAYASSTPSRNEEKPQASPAKFHGIRHHSGGGVPGWKLAPESFRFALTQG